MRSLKSYLSASNNRRRKVHWCAEQNCYVDGSPKTCIEATAPKKKAAKRMGRR